MQESQSSHSVDADLRQKQTAHGTQTAQLRDFFASDTGQYVFDFTREHVTKRYHFLGVWSEVSPLNCRLIPVLRKNIVVKSGGVDISSRAETEKEAAESNASSECLLSEDLGFRLPHLPFKAESLDGILLHHSICHLSKADLRLTLEQAYQCLDGGSRLIIIAFSRAHLWHLLLYIPLWLLRFLPHKISKRWQCSRLPHSAQLGFSDIRRIKQNLQKIGYDAIESKAVFCRPLLAPDKLKKLTMLERLGRYFNTLVAPVVLIRASKEVIPLTPIGIVKSKEVIMNNGAVGYTRATHLKDKI